MVTDTELPVRTLPSGKRVTLSVRAVPDRPWEVEYGAGTCFVRRPRRGDSSQWEYFKGGATHALGLIRHDAEALATFMNENMMRRASTRPPPGFK